MLTVVTPESLLICVHTVRWAPEMNQRQWATPAAALAWAPLASTVQPDICQISFLSPLFPRNSDFPLGLAGGGAWLSVAAALVTSDQSAALPLSSPRCAECRGPAPGPGPAQKSPRWKFSIINLGGGKFDFYDDFLLLGMHPPCTAPGVSLLL